MQITIYSQDGKEVSKIALPKEMFEVPVNESLIHKMLVLQEANKRRPIAHTKTRGEVRGSTRKLTPQKGRGRARQGSVRSPVRRGGGVVFGPRNTRNFEKKMPTKERRKALFSALSSKAQDKKILGLKEYKGEINTKQFDAMLKKLPVGRNVLVVLPNKDEAIEKSSNNLQNVKTIVANYLNVRDILQHETVLLMQDAVETMKKTFLEKTTVEA